MQVNGRDAIFMGVQDVFDIGEFHDIGRTFIVQNDVVTFGPIGIVIDVKTSLDGRIPCMDLGYFNHRACFDPPLQHILLLTIIVAASACDQKCLQRFRLC